MSIYAQNDQDSAAIAGNFLSPQAETLQQYGVDLETITSADPWGFSHHMLKEVSRTFAINIAVLPSPLKKPVLLAYLFCRIADTVEDDPELPVTEKTAHLQRFLAIFATIQGWQERTRAFVEALPVSYNAHAADSCKSLTSLSEIPLRLFFEETPDAFGTVSRWVMEMCRGMIIFSEKKGSLDEVLTLQDVKELEEYCYYVAGTVGNMLSELFYAYSPWISKRRFGKMQELAVSFGLGLQITNIIKGISEDMERDVCFIPEELARRYGVTTTTMFYDENRDQAQRVVHALIGKALGHLNDAMAYSTLLPHREPRMRLFCFWPVLLAAETLKAASLAPDLIGGPEVKISRTQVKSILKSSTLRSWSNRRMNRLFGRYRTQISGNLRE